MRLIINKEKTFQTFRGIGASGAWWAQVVGGWDHEDPASGKKVNERIAELLYNPETGIGMRIYRYNLGGGSKNSGSSVFPNKNRMAESFDNNGNYDWTRDKNAVNMMKLCVKEGADEVILFSNSPPERLTKNHKSCLDKAWHSNLPRKNEDAFSDYLLDCAEHFLSEDIPVKFISPVNEPMWVWTEKNGQEGCHYTPFEVYSLLKKLSSKLKNRPALRDVRISACENGDIRWFNKAYTFAVLGNKKIRECCDGIDVHSYCLPIPVPFLNNRLGFLKRYRAFLNIFFPGETVNMSEWCHMKGGRDSGMNSALVTAKTMFEDVTILGVSSWQHWIAVSEVDYCDGLIYINEEAGTFSTTKRLFVTGNFSKYVPRNAKRIEIKTDDKDINAVAFHKDGKTVAVLINATKNAKNLENTFGKAVITSLTDKDNDLTEAEVAENGNIIIPPESVTTIII